MTDIPTLTKLGCFAEENDMHSLFDVLEFAQPNSIPVTKWKENKG